MADKEKLLRALGTDAATFREARRNAQERAHESIEQEILGAAHRNDRAA